MKDVEMDFKDHIRCLFMNSLYPVSKKWSAELNRLMDAGAKVKREYHSERTAKLGKYKVWVSNWPYAYGSDYSQEDGYSKRYLPDCATRLRLKRYINAVIPKPKWED